MSDNDTKTTKFTPGPWHTTNHGKGRFVVSNIQKENRHNCGITDICELYRDYNKVEEVQSNAALVSAAPDMYAALEAILRMIQSHQVYDKDARGIIENALAKARGEQ